MSAIQMFNFGVGTVIGRRNGVDATGAAIVNPTPAQLGTVQDVTVTFKRKLVSLRGQKQFAADIAAGEFDISGSFKFASQNGNAFNSLFLGQTATPATTEQDAIDEPHAAATTITIAPPSTGTFIHDLGVKNITSILTLTRVASAPTVGQYSVTEPGGVYTFNAGETGSLLISYSYSSTSTTMVQVVGTNQLMGISPSFELHLQSFYPNSISSTVNTANLVLNAVKAENLGMPFKNIDHTVFDMSFMAFADATDTVYKWSFTV